MAKRISVINFKGGVGKTTLAFHLAAGLARFHESRVLLVDMDHQSSLSIVCLGADGWETVADSGDTVNKIFAKSHKEVLPGMELVRPARFGVFLQSQYAGVYILPASLDLDDTEIELTASHEGNAIQSEWNKRTLICRWIEETRVDDQFDYILFDCPPATKIVSQNAIAASHGYLVPVVPEAVMVRGAPHLHGLIKSGIDDKLSALAKFGQARESYVANTELAGLVVTRIQRSGGYSGYTNDHSQHLKSLEKQWGDNLLKPYIVHGVGVSEALAERVPVYNRSNTQNVGYRGIDRMYKQLTENVKDRVDRL